MPATSVSLLGDEVLIEGDQADGYFQSFTAGDELADSVVTGVLPFVVPDGVCLDIGANLGLYCIALARRFPQLRAYAFEPVPRTFEYLAANIAGNAPQVTAFPYACGTADEIADMQFVDHFAAGSHFSVEGSLAKVDNEDQTVSVQVKRVDSIVAELGVDRVDLIKIDVEGFELDVLEGAADTLATYHPITQLEFNGWTFMSHRRILPQEVLDRICRTFPFIYVHARYDDRLAKISVPLDQQSLLYANAVHGGVDNLLCAFEELIPDAPSYAEVWPDYVQTRDVQIGKLQEQINQLLEHIRVHDVHVAERDQTQQAETPAALAHVTEMDGSTRQLRESVRELSAELDAARAFADALQATLSWRVTKPLRAVRARTLRRTGQSPQHSQQP